jgi:hypothetical protein
MSSPLIILYSWQSTNYEIQVAVFWLVALLRFVIVWLYTSVPEGHACSSENTRRNKTAI